VIDDDVAHHCGVCFSRVENHDSRAANNESYFPPMCCIGCPCGTYVKRENMPEEEREWWDDVFAANTKNDIDGYRKDIQ